MSLKKIKRMRVFAEPNGSGKSVVYDLIRKQFKIGYYVNTDNIEHQLSGNGFIHLSDFGIKLTPEKFNEYISTTPFINKMAESSLKLELDFKDNVIISENKNSNSYEAAFVADILRNEMILEGTDFSFETVLSHPSKLETFKFANKSGFRSYLYFVCTESPFVNHERVESRVKKGGHPVPKEKIFSRYFRSLELLSDSVKALYRSYIFDNSVSELRLVAEYTPERQIIPYEGDLPGWVKK